MEETKENHCEPKTYDIYSVVNYNKLPESQFDSVKFTGTTQQIRNELKTRDKCYHERLFKTDNLKLAVDNLGCHNPNITLEIIFKYICEFLNIQAKDISYTTNFKVKEGSHHIVIPKYYLSSTKQKQLWYDFREKYQLGKEIDADIFDKKGWFRLPYQTKGKTHVNPDVQGSQHIIQRGKTLDFVLKYIPDNSVEYIYEPVKKLTQIKVVKSPKNIITQDNKMPDETEIESKDIQKYLDYSLLIDKNLIGTHTHNRKNRYIFIKASANIGVPFDVVYEKIMKNIPNNDKTANLEIYHSGNNRKKVGWISIKKLAYESNSEAKILLDSKWKNNEIVEKLDDAIEVCIASGTDYDIAKALSLTDLCYNTDMEEQIMYSTGLKKNPVWCSFQDHKWSYGFNPTKITLYISTKFHELFLKKYLESKTKYEELKEKFEEILKSKPIPEKKKEKPTFSVEEKLIEDELEREQKRMKVILEVAVKLKKTTDKNNILREFFDIVNYDNKTNKCFLELLDTNQNILCCKNGVIDLRNKQFRKGKPSDTVSCNKNRT